jgi:hypothetical protein
MKDACCLTMAGLELSHLLTKQQSKPTSKKKKNAAQQTLVSLGEFLSIFVCFCYFLHQTAHTD